MNSKKLKGFFRPSSSPGNDGNVTASTAGNGNKAMNMFPNHQIFDLYVYMDDSVSWLGEKVENIGISNNFRISHSDNSIQHQKSWFGCEMEWSMMIGLVVIMKFDNSLDLINLTSYFLGRQSHNSQKLPNSCCIAP